MQALGFIEAPFLSISAMLAHEAATAADVHILGFEGTGNENLLIRLSGDIAQVRAALDAAEKLAPQLGASIVTGAIPLPAEGFDPPHISPTLTTRFTAAATSSCPPIIHPTPQLPKP
jgi:microcompartment protein CcmL/EutN